MTYTTAELITILTAAKYPKASGDALDASTDWNNALDAIISLLGGGTGSSGTLLIGYGTSFPASPAEGQLYYRTDLGKLYIYINGEWTVVSLGSVPSDLRGYGIMIFGIYANRPAPGVAGRIYYCTDTHKIYLDTGTEWLEIAQNVTENIGEINMQGAGIMLQGTFSEIPAAGVGGRLYYCTDTQQVFLDTGSTWVEILNASTGGGLTPEEHAAISHNGYGIMLNGLDAEKPAAGTLGRLYWATDTYKVYFDTGEAWTQIAAPVLSALQGTLATSQVAVGAITEACLAAGAITATKIADDSISTAKLQAASITTAKLAASSVTATNIVSGTITASKIATGAIETNALAAGCVTTTKLGADSVTANSIVANAITSAKIAANAVTATAIAAGAVSTAHLAAGSISADKLQANSVTSASIAANSITSSMIQANAIQTSALAASVITSDKIYTRTIIAENIDYVAGRSIAVTTSNVLQTSNDTLKNVTALSYTKYKEIKVNDKFNQTLGESFKVTWYIEQYDPYIDGSVHSRLYINGVAVSSDVLSGHNAGATGTCVVTQALYPNDLLQIYCYTTNQYAATNTVSNMRLYYGPEGIAVLRSVTNQDP